VLPTVPALPATATLPRVAALPATAELPLVPVLPAAATLPSVTVPSTPVTLTSSGYPAPAMPDTLKLTQSESVTIKRRTPEALEASYGSGGSPPPKHYHPSQDEHFEVLSGTMRVRLEGEERSLEPGETLDIPRGTVHQMWNPGDESARVSWRTSPALRTEDWFRSIDSLHREGKVGDNGMPGPLAYGVMLTEFRDVFRLVAGPETITYGGLALLGAVGRLRGYSPRLGAGN
jgi:quercetin dioxygenase-like cupin family protein